jgi:hypothetical protein
MALTVTLAFGQDNDAVVEQNVDFTVTVANTSSSSVTLTDLRLSCPNGSITIVQPVWQTPNVPVGTGNPTISASSSLSFYVPLVVRAPNFPGISPNSPFGGAPNQLANPVSNPNYVVTAVAQASDGSVGQGSITFGALSAISPFPTPQGGTSQYAAGGNAVNWFYFP